jgi:hypothetical protein
MTIFLGGINFLYISGSPRRFSKHIGQIHFCLLAMSKSSFRKKHTCSAAKMGSGKVIKGGYSMYPPSPTSPTRSHFTTDVFENILCKEDYPEMHLGGFIAKTGDLCVANHVILGRYSSRFFGFEKTFKSVM